MVSSAAAGPASLAGRAGEIVAHAEAAVRTTRIVLAVSACFVLIAYRPLSGSASWWTVGVVPVVIALAVIALNAISVRAQRAQATSKRLTALSQALDVGATVALVLALDAPLRGEAWVLLVIPVVSGSIRLGAAVSMFSWAGGCALYAALTLTGVVTTATSGEFLIRTSGILLAVAATIGILARWMREGWEIQNELTEAASASAARLATVETASRAMARVPPEDALKACLAYTLELGFATATIRAPHATCPGVVVGRADLVSEPDKPEPVEPGEVALTTWVEGGTAAAHSASALESHTSAVVTGWSEEQIDPQQADALSTLVAQASAAIETSSLLAQIREEAAHDPLTGLANRRVFEEELERQAASEQEIAVIFIDVDHFKSINDKYGHLVGDEILTATAGRLRSSVRPTDLVARIGGDEFVILFRQIAPSQALGIGEAIVAAMNVPVALSGATLDVHISVGLGTAVGPVAAKDLLDTADRAVYQAKEAGRNRLAHVAFEPGEARGLDRASQPGALAA